MESKAITSITFFVPGFCITKGSGHAMRSASGKVFVVQNNAKRLRPWEGRIAEVAAEAGAAGVYSANAAFKVEMAFLLKRPVSHTKSDGTLRDSAPFYPIVQKCDLDKMERAVLDALTSVLFLNDSQVCRIESEKTYCTADQTPGVYIRAEAQSDQRRKS